MKSRASQVLDAIIDLGVYPVAVIDADGKRTERTPWQDGWNAACAEMHRIAAHPETIVENNVSE